MHVVFIYTDAVVCAKIIQMHKVNIILGIAEYSTCNLVLFSSRIDINVI